METTTINPACFAGKVVRAMYHELRWRPVIHLDEVSASVYMKPAVSKVPRSANEVIVPVDLTKWSLASIFMLKKRSGIRIDLLYIIGIIMSRGPTGGTKLVDALGCSSACVSQQLSELTAMGLVRCTGTPDADRRRRYYGITLGTMTDIVRDLGNFYSAGADCELNTLTKNRKTDEYSA